MRTRAAAGLAFVGVSLEDVRNRESHADREIGADGGGLRTLVITATEDSEIARQVRALLAR